MRFVATIGLVGFCVVGETLASPSWWRNPFRSQSENPRKVIPISPHNSNAVPTEPLIAASESVLKDSHTVSTAQSNASRDLLPAIVFGVHAPVPVHTFEEFLAQCPETSENKFEIVDQFGSVRAKPDMTLKDKLYENVPGIIFGDASADPSHALDPVLLGAGRRSAVYAILGYDNKWVLKYNWYCGDKVYEPVDPLLVEYYHLTKVTQLAAEKLVNEALYYSQDIDYDAGFDKFQVRQDLPPLSDTCPADSLRGPKGLKPSLRYIITERVGISLMDYITKIIKGPMPFLDAVKVGMKIIIMLEQFHKLNMLHGDIHPGNITNRDRTSSVIDGSSEFVFIDLGRTNEVDMSVDYPHGEDTPMEGLPITTLAGTPLSMRQRKHFQLSPAESMSIKPSYRDEVFRALSTIAFLVHGPRYMALVMKLATDAIPRYFKHKNEDNLFDCILPIPDTRDTVEFTVAKALGVKGKFSDAADLVEELFEEVMQNVRGIEIRDNPRYDFILQKFAEIVSVVENGFRSGELQERVREPSLTAAVAHSSTGDEKHQKAEEKAKHYAAVAKEQDYDNWLTASQLAKQSVSSV